MVSASPSDGARSRRLSLVQRAARRMPLGLRVTLGFLRFWVGGLGVTCSFLYPFYMLLCPFLLPGEPIGVFTVIFALSLATPFSITVLLACGDLIFGAATTSCWEAAGYIALGCCILVGLGVLSNLTLNFIGVAFLYLLHVAAAVARARCCGGGGGGHGRAADLYQRYLGIAG